MSVMVLNEEKFVKLFNYLTDLEESSGNNGEKISGEISNRWVDIIREKNINLVTYLYKMNVLNYCARYNERAFFTKINFTNFEYEEKEILDILKSLRYNTCDYFETPELNGIIKQLENNAE